MRTMPNNRAKRKPRWLRYSLRSMLLVVLVLSVWLGYKANQAAKQRRAVRTIYELGGQVGYDFAYTEYRQPPGPAWIHKLLGIDWFNAVVDVDVIDFTVDDHQLAALIGDLPDIKHMDLTDTTVNGEGLEHVASLRQLETLSLGDTHITDANLRHLRRCRALTALWLYRTGITDAGLVHLSGLKNLKYLSVEYTKVTDEGVARLQAELPNLEIRF